ncbi:MAG: protocatechuate 3,4-dioxygenase, partial [Bacteroidota bacterium]
NWLQLGLGATIGTVSASVIGCKEPITEKESAIAAESENCTVTARQTMGPFHPNKDQADKDFDLTSVNGSKARPKGEILYVRGRVTDENCEPVSNAWVMIWHASSEGKYNHDYDNNVVKEDPHFQGWGQVRTNERGEYGFKTIKPGAYPVDPESGRMRTPHIHYKVSKRGYHELITQLYFQGEALNESDLLANELSDTGKAQLIQVIDKNAEGIEAGAGLITFDITLNKVLPKEKKRPELAEYIGDYEIDLNVEEFEQELEVFYGGKRTTLTLSITKENDVLMAYMPIQPKSEIFLKTDGRYAYDAFEANIEFIKDETGTVSSIALHRYYEFPILRGKKV